MLDFRGDGPGQSADLLTESFGFGRGGVEERGDGTDMVTVDCGGVFIRLGVYCVFRIAS